MHNNIPHSLTWQHWFSCSPVALITGILMYFALPEEPSLWTGLISVAGIVVLYILRHDTVKLKIGAFIWLIYIGFWLAAYYSNTVTTEFLDKQYRFANITATVSQIIEGDNKYKIILESVTSSDIARTTALRVRLSMRRKTVNFREGDMIQTRATLFPPSRPISKHAFDFTQYFYFRNIDAVGYVTGKVKILNAQSKQKHEFRFLSSLRSFIAHYILQRSEQPATGILIALSTGQKDAITPKTRDILTASSLGHMLAISGMHMGIVCGAVFMLIRFCASCVPTIALQYPVKKIAAVAAMICGGAYLALADFPISAIRAYVMISVIFIAVLCNRQADTLRCVVLAALGIMLIKPQAVMEIGFQLSFAATLALIIVYRRARKFNIIYDIRQRHLIIRFGLYFVQLALSSFIAGMITAPLVAYHFNHVALYGIIANMLALPVLSFFVAPALLLCVVTYPFGAAPIFLSLAQYGTDWIIAAARLVADLPSATYYIAPFSAWMAMVLTAVMIILFAARSIKQIIICIVIIGICLFFIARPSIQADILIAEDGSAVAVKNNERWVLLKGTSRNFHVSMWEQMLNVTMQKAGELWSCSPAGCDGTVKDKNIRVRFDYKIKEPLCLSNTDIVISTFYSNRWNCASSDILRIDRDALERFGAHMITIDDDISVWHSCLDAPKRIWKRCNS